MWHRKSRTVHAGTGLQQKKDALQACQAASEYATLYLCQSWQREINNYAWRSIRAWFDREQSTKKAHIQTVKKQKRKNENEHLCREVLLSKGARTRRGDSA
eukprot:scpid110017/ scgid15113/ 